MTSSVEILSNPLLDDICIGLASGSISSADLPATMAGNLGPLIELSHVHPDLCQQSRKWLNAIGFSGLLSNLRRTGKWFDTGDTQGFVTIPAIKQCQTNWTDFAMRAKRAATESGFSTDDGGKLVAAMWEFRSNISEHSQCEDLGYLVFHARPRRFEFVVVDAGIGGAREPAYSSGLCLSSRCRHRAGAGPQRGRIPFPQSTGPRVWFPSPSRWPRQHQPHHTLPFR